MLCSCFGDPLQRCQAWTRAINQSPAKVSFSHFVIVLLNVYWKCSVISFFISTFAVFSLQSRLFALIDSLVFFGTIMILISV